MLLGTGRRCPVVVTPASNCKVHARARGGATGAQSVQSWRSPASVALSRAGERELRCKREGPGARRRGALDDITLG
jgi:hypothetical protein